MVVKDFIEYNREYICYINVTLEDWKEVLQNNSLMKKYKDVLFRFFLKNRTQVYIQITC